MEQITKEVKTVTRAILDHIRENRWLYLVAWVLTGVITAALFQLDTHLAASIRIDRSDALLKASKAASFLGDFTTGTLSLAAVLLGISFISRQKDRLRKSALLIVIAATLAGGLANLLRSTTGRARPNAKFRAGEAPAEMIGELMQPGFRGFSLESRFHSFPSAHSATAFATATALAAAIPPLAIPALLVAGSVSFSRLYLSQHYPSDVFLGIMIGTLIGFPLGRGLRASLRPTSGGASPAPPAARQTTQSKPACPLATHIEEA